MISKQAADFQSQPQGEGQAGKRACRVFWLRIQGIFHFQLKSGRRRLPFMKAPNLRYVILTGVAIFMLGIGFATNNAWGQGGSIAPGGPDLQTTLEKGLKARRPVEFQFIAQVVELVDNGTLPSSVVITTFLWARRHRPFPFPYFEFGLRNQATQLGIAL